MASRAGGGRRGAGSHLAAVVEAIEYGARAALGPAQQHVREEDAPVVEALLVHALRRGWGGGGVGWGPGGVGALGLGAGGWLWGEGVRQGGGGGQGGDLEGVGELAEDGVGVVGVEGLVLEA